MLHLASYSTLYAATLVPDEPVSHALGPLICLAAVADRRASLVFSVGAPASNAGQTDR